MNKIVFFIGLFVLGLFFLVPAIFVILLSLFDGWKYPSLLADKISLNAYLYIFKNPYIVDCIMNSLKIAVLTVVLNLLVGMPAAYAIQKYDFFAKKAIEFLIMTPIFVPPIVYITSMHKLFIHIGIVDTVVGIAFSHSIISVPYMIKCLCIGFENISDEWDDAARTLGIGFKDRFLNIKLYFIMPSILTGASITILISLGQYLTSLIIGGGYIKTVTMDMVPFFTSGNYFIGSAYCVVFIFISIIILSVIDFIMHKYYIDGEKI